MNRFIIIIIIQSFKLINDSISRSNTCTIKCWQNSVKNVQISISNVLTLLVHFVNKYKCSYFFIIIFIFIDKGFLFLGLTVREEPGSPPGAAAPSASVWGSRCSWGRGLCSWRVPERWAWWPTSWWSALWPPASPARGETWRRGRDHVRLTVRAELH